jgi:branched-subunit amino acid aminotransferase/4-amino-4-deoxychorismate lyase
MIERAFVYGDLLFESVKVKNGKICFADKHFHRLIQSAKALSFETTSLTQEFFVQEINNNLSGKNDARIRFVLYRNSEGFYTPSSNDCKWNIEIFELPEKDKICNRLGIFSEFKKSCNKLSNIKSGNALIYVLAGIFAKQNQFDDCLILNEHGRIAESTSSNIFIVKGSTLYTPPLSEACVDGIMKHVVIEKAKEHGISAEEITLTQNQLLDADEVFFTNAINGIVPVNSFQTKIFTTTFISKLKSILEL